MHLLRSVNKFGAAFSTLAFLVVLFGLEFLFLKQLKPEDQSALLGIVADNFSVYFIITILVLCGWGAVLFVIFQFYVLPIRKIIG